MRREFDLEIRTRQFAARVLAFVKVLPYSTPNKEITKQVVRSAGSIGANYIEARESLGSKDNLMKLRTARKEAKETQYWLELTDCRFSQRPEKEDLIAESSELVKILSAIIRNTEAKRNSTA